MDIDPNDHYYNQYEQDSERKNKLKGFLSMLVMMAGATIVVLFLFMVASFFG